MALLYSPRRIGYSGLPRPQFAWRVGPSSCGGGVAWSPAPGAIRTRPVIRGVTVIGLLIGFALLYLGHPYA